MGDPTIRRAFIILALVVAAIALLAFGINRYLSSSQVTAKVTEQIQAVYGGEVKVASVHVGLKGASLANIAFFEDGDHETPWLTAEQVHTDLTLLQLAHGERTPGAVTLVGARVHLRFDRNGHLASRLPMETGERGSIKGASLVKDFPTVTIENGQVTLRQVGRDDLVIERISARLSTIENRIVLEGKGENSRWGQWSFDGGMPSDGETIAFRSRSAGSIHVAGDMLKQLPFVSDAVWREVQISAADTSAAIDLDYSLRKNQLSYRLEAHPSRAAVRVTSLDLEAKDAQGTVIVEDEVVRLRDTQLHTLDGTVRGEAELDFRSEPVRMTFPRLEAVGLDVSRFPPSWQFPKQIKGHLVGRASLEVLVGTTGPTPPSVATLVGVAHGPASQNLPIVAALEQGNTVHTSGAGKARILDATFAGQKVEEPIEVELRAVPGGFRFGNEQTRRELPRPERSAAQIGRPFEFINAAVGLPLLLVGVQTPYKPAPAQNENRSSFINIQFKMKELDLAKLVKDAELNVPYAIAGKVSFQVKAGIPLDGAGDVKKYTFHGDAQVRDLDLAGFRVASAETEVDLADGLLQLTKLKGTLPPDASDPKSLAATFNGAATLQIAPPGDLHLGLAIDHFSLQQVAKLTGKRLPVQGEVSGVVNLTAAYERLQDPSAWRGGGTLSSPRLLAYGWTLRDGAAQMRLNNGALVLDSFDANVEGAKITGNGGLELSGKLPYRANIKLREGNLAALNRLDPQFRLPIEIAGNIQMNIEVQGTAAPLTWAASGSVQSAMLEIHGVPLQKISFDWQLGPERVNIKTFHAQIFDGEVHGDGVIPLRDDVAGSLTLQVKSVDAAVATRSFPKTPIKMQGKVDGELKATAPPVVNGQPRPIDMQFDLQAPLLRIQNIPAEKVAGVVKYRHGLFDYQLQGKSLGGTFELEGQLPPNGDKQPIKKGRINIRGIEMSRLLAVIGDPETARHYRGQIHAALSMQPSAAGWPEGAGRIALAGIRYKEHLLVDTLVGDLEVSEKQIRLRNMSGGFDQGTIQARAVYDLANPARGWFTVDLDNIESSHLLAPWLGDALNGVMAARVRGKFGPEWTGTATIDLARGRLAGVSVAQARIPMSFRVAPATGLGQIEILDFTSQAGQGAMKGAMSATWGQTTQLEGKLRFTHVDVPTLLRETGESPQLGGGKLNGYLRVVGRDVRSVDDLSGVFQATFEQAQPLQLPVLTQIAPFIGVGTSTTFQKGVIEARLDHGEFRIQRLVLEGTNIKMFIHGTVSLAGRLNLSVDAKTGSLGLEVPGFRLLQLRIPTTGAIPLTVAQEAITFLSNRLIHLQVTGTIRSPVIRVNPLVTLTQEAIRYFLNRNLGPFSINPEEALFNR